MRARHFLASCICILHLFIPLPLLSAVNGIWIHHLPTESTPTTFDEVPIWDASSYTTKKLLLSNLVTYRSIAPSTDAQSLLSMTFAEMLTALGGTTTITDLDALPGDTVDDDLLDAAIVATLNQDSTGSAGSLKSTATTGLMLITGPGAGTTRVKTIRDANDTILELGGSYTPTGTWDWSSATLTFGTLAPTALTLPSSNADPASTAGAIRHDTTVTGFATGCLVWYDGDEKRYLIDLDTLPEEADDGKALTYDSTYDKFTLSTASAVGAMDDLSDVTLTGAKIGDVLAATTDGEWINIGAGNNGEFLQTRGDGYIPRWATPAGGGDMSASSTTNPELPDPSLHPGELLRINLAGDGFDTLAVAAAGVYPDFTAYCDAGDLVGMRQHKYYSMGYLQRSKFTCAGANTITIRSGVYEHAGGTYWQTVFWSADITFTNTDTSTGWKYLYIDDSTLTGAPSMLTASNFIASTTAPTWSTTPPRRGWYNGNDRCIFAYYVWSGVIWPFYHDGGDYVQYTGEGAPSRSYTDLSAAETVTATIPAFSTRGKFSIMCTLNGSYLVYVSTTTSAYRTLGCGASGTNVYFVLFEHYTSSSQSLNLALSNYTGTNSVSLQTNGWYFPAGM